ncbi:hypothetical protein Btru_056481 [Bulinus truncatus]|nr:hypothetical protein Btru_056481 [Bulinus truncatus]
MSSDFHLQETDHVTIPSEALKPDLACKDIIKELVQKKYGLTLTEISPLNGYDDLNFHIKASCEHANPHLNQVSNDGYFLKVINLRDSRRPDYLNAQVQVVEHLLKKGINCQSIVRGINGESFTECTAESKTGENVTYMVSLKSFITGEIVHKVPLTPRLLYSLGQYVADITKALQDFIHPFYNTFICTWSMDSVPKLTDIMFAVKDNSMRNICEGVVEAFQNEVISLRPGFRRGQIHGDLNEQNILVRREVCPNNHDDHFQICGLLDFQDTALSYPLYDLAMLVCYMLMKYSEVPLLDIPGYILAGYRTKLDLTADEKVSFRTCVAARMVQSLVMGAYTHHMDPSNDYVLTTSRYGWQALSTFWSADKKESEARWDHIVETFQL